jgi:hypothetical protein
LTSSTKSSRLSLAFCIGALLLGGCAGTAPLATRGAPVELRDVPFFAQTDYQCGPAALATLLAHAGLPVTADGLVDAVYVAGLRGSLQPELLGATRRHGLIPYVLPSQPEALLEELAAGRPVLVLQNLGFDRAPVWHYAVVVGYDGEHVILRSGTEQRRLERTGRFLKTWERGGRWAFVALPPGALPAASTPALYVRALAGAEPLLPPADADAAYSAALERWPDDAPLLFAAAARSHARRDLNAAKLLYERLLERAPDDAAARNNLANLLADEGCPAAALAQARRALALVASGSALHAAIADTVAALERAPRAHVADPPECR